MHVAAACAKRQKTSVMPNPKFEFNTIIVIVGPVRLGVRKGGGRGFAISSSLFEKCQYIDLACLLFRHEPFGDTTPLPG